MTRYLRTLVLLAIPPLAFAAGLRLIRPSYINWGSTPAERTQSLPGDPFLPAGTPSTTRAITIQAPVEQVWPWLVQIGAGRGGLYSYLWFEHLLFCEIDNLDRIDPALQELHPGDLVPLCAGDFGPPPYRVAAVEPGQSLALGHQDPQGVWVEIWQMVLRPLDAQTTRMLFRTSNTEAAGFLQILEPGTNVMERRMMAGIRERAEGALLPWYAKDLELVFWLAAFLGAVLAGVLGPFRSRWQAPLGVALGSGLITLLLVWSIPPVWIDALAALLVWAALIRSLQPAPQSRRSAALAE